MNMDNEKIYLTINGYCKLLAEMDLQSFNKIKGRIVIVEPTETQDNIVDIGDTVTVRFFDGEEQFKLVESVHANSDIIEISLNSPLGRNIYQRELGYVGSYNVQDNTFDFVIAGITKAETKQQGPTLKKTGNEK